MKDIKEIIISKALDHFSKKFIELLEEKHLYQNTKINSSEFETLISDFTYSDFFGPYVTSGTIDKKAVGNRMATKETEEKNRLKEIVFNLLNKPWKVVIEDKYLDSHYGLNLESITELLIPLPTIKIKCNFCNSINPPHNPGYLDYNHDLPNLTFENESNIEEKTVQLFFLPYQCQSCKREPIIFTVARKGLKLQLVGRSQFENVDVPSYIPSEEKEYYSDAIIAYNTGRLLAALYYLRALVEHYLRRILNNDSKISGDELGEQYSKILDDEFPKKFTSLKTIYSELSEKLHKFDKSEKQFQKSISDIEKHFDLLQHFSLKL